MFTCANCPNVFKTGASLNFHTRKQHGRASVPATVIDNGSSECITQKDEAYGSCRSLPQKPRVLKFGKLVGIPDYTQGPFKLSRVPLKIAKDRDEGSLKCPSSSSSVIERETEQAVDGEKIEVVKPDQKNRRKPMKRKSSPDVGSETEPGITEEEAILPSQGSLTTPTTLDSDIPILSTQSRQSRASSDNISKRRPPGSPARASSDNISKGRPTGSPARASSDNISKGRPPPGSPARASTDDVSKGRPTGSIARASSDNISKGRPTGSPARASSDNISKGRPTGIPARASSDDVSKGRPTGSTARASSDNISKGRPTGSPARASSDNISKGRPTGSPARASSDNISKGRPPPGSPARASTDDVSKGRPDNSAQASTDDISNGRPVPKRSRRGKHWKYQEEEEQTECSKILVAESSFTGRKIKKPSDDNISSISNTSCSELGTVASDLARTKIKGTDRLSIDGSTSSSSRSTTPSVSENTDAEIGRCSPRSNDEQQVVLPSASYPWKPYSGKAHQCPICGQSGFRHSRHYLNHLEMHEGKRPYPCPFAECGMAYETDLELMEHVNIRHSKESTFTCSTCEVGFKTHRGLNNHKCKQSTINNE